MLFSRLFCLFSREKFSYSQALEWWKQTDDECAIKDEHRDLPKSSNKVCAELRVTVIRLIQRISSDTQRTAKHRNEQADCYVNIVIFDRGISVHKCRKEWEQRVREYGKGQN